MHDHLPKIWEPIAAVIGLQVSRETFQRWFSAVELVAADEDSLTLCVPNHICQLWIESKYFSLVNGAVEEVLGAPHQLRFTLRQEGTSTVSESTLPATPAAVPADLAAARSGHDSTSADELGATPPANSASAPGGTGMNPRHTFDTFVVGSNNQFAQAASRAVAEAPAKTYNPLFIYGGVGLGKTHLMQAIGQHIQARKKGHKVLYVSSERFTNEFIDAIQNNSLVKFRKRYRLADVLLIDDIQFLGGKERSQEEFFHTFNALFDGHKQIVMSSDRPPSEIQNLEQRLVSRFEWGLTAELQPPDLETRLAILRKKAETMQTQVRPDVLEFLAQRIRTNVRRLEGALMRVATYASLSGKEPTTESIEHLLKDILTEEARRTVGIDQIQRIVAEHYDVRLADMTSKRRPANIAFPRQIAMYLARELTKSSLNEIGDVFGGRDHGTVLHAHRLVKKRMLEDEKVRGAVHMLENQLQR